MKLNEVLNFDKMKKPLSILDQLAQTHKINPVLAQALFAKGLKVEKQLHKLDDDQARKVAGNNLLKNVHFYQDYDL